jgi:hypothetical protein
MRTTIDGFTILLRRGPLINGERGWEYRIYRDDTKIYSDDALISSGWSAGSERDALDAAQSYLKNKP